MGRGGGHAKLHRQSVYGPSDREIRIRKSAIDMFSVLDSEQTGKVSAHTMHLAFIGLGNPKSVADVKKMFHKIENVKFDEEISELDLQDFILLTDIYDGHVFGEGVSVRLLTFALRRQENFQRILHRTHQPDHHQSSRARRRAQEEGEEEEEVCPVVLPDLRTPSALYRSRSRRRNRTPGTPATISRMRNRWDTGVRDVDLNEMVRSLKEFDIKMHHPSFDSQATPPHPKYVTKPLSRRNPRLKDPLLTEVRPDLGFEFYSKQVRSALASRRGPSVKEHLVEKITRDPQKVIRNFHPQPPRMVRSSADIL